MCKQYHRTTLNSFLNGMKNGDVNGTCEQILIARFIHDSRKECHTLCMCMFLKWFVFAVAQNKVNIQFLKAARRKTFKKMCKSYESSRANNFHLAKKSPLCIIRHLLVPNITLSRINLFWHIRASALRLIRRAGKIPSSGGWQVSQGNFQNLQNYGGK